MSYGRKVYSPHYWHYNIHDVVRPYFTGGTEWLQGRGTTIMIGSQSEFHAAKMYTKLYRHLSHLRETATNISITSSVRGGGGKKKDRERENQRTRERENEKSNIFLERIKRTYNGFSMNLMRPCSVPCKTYHSELGTSFPGFFIPIPWHHSLWLLCNYINKKEIIAFWVLTQGFKWDFF